MAYQLVVEHTTFHSTQEAELCELVYRFAVQIVTTYSETLSQNCLTELHLKSKKAHAKLKVVQIQRSTKKLFWGWVVGFFALR